MNPEERLLARAVQYAVRDVRKQRERQGLVEKPKPFVYFIRAESGPIKIGWAVNPINRLGTLQIAHHEALEIIGTVTGGKMVEQALHAEFAADRIRGEWFRPSDRLLARIKELTGI